MLKYCSYCCYAVAKSNLRRPPICRCNNGWYF